MSLAKERMKYLARQRHGTGEPKLTGLDEIRMEGYEDYSYQKAQTNSYEGKEAEAYAEGWRQAHFEMTGVRL